ncbi:hypothetical protein B0I37DRAFT_228918 [Chaetomium sp. MPI-CAGE-AT-0009]|nr:hypothetical protein B0I37DRAFT_228918 [Chaetomium sp. MPI-CAGE-AT-0009]
MSTSPAAPSGRPLAAPVGPLPSALAYHLLVLILPLGCGVSRPEHKLQVLAQCPLGCAGERRGERRRDEGQ